jgi:hypothetical protein
MGEEVSVAGVEVLGAAVESGLAMYPRYLMPVSCSPVDAVEPEVEPEVEAEAVEGVVVE